MSIFLNIKKIFPKIKIKNNDLVMFDIDSAISIYYPFKSAKKKVEYLCKELINYFGKDGTIIVPTFTYSFTKKKIIIIKLVKVMWDIFQKFLEN